MMPTLRAASVRHLLRHPAQLALALIGLTLGVGTIVAVDVATASSQRAFELSLQAVNGAATHQITGGPRGIGERLYAQLRTQAAAGAPLRFAPLVTGYVTVGERTMQLVGVDPFAAVELADEGRVYADQLHGALDRKSTRLNSSHVKISYAVFCLKKKNIKKY